MSKTLTLILALVVAGGVLAFVAFGNIEQNLVYYWSAEELLDKGQSAYGATVRLGGLVQEGSVVWEPETLKLQFKIASQKEPTQKAVLVNSKGAPPQMFREGMGVIVEGVFDGKLFQSERVMVKHSNEYRAPQPGEEHKDAYTTLVKEE